MSKLTPSTCHYIQINQVHQAPSLNKVAPLPLESNNSRKKAVHFATPIESNAVKMSPLVEPIKGRAIFNNSIVDYLCDGGADYTIINRELFEKLKTQAPRTELKRYAGKPLTSCTSEINVLGIVQLERCIIDPNVELDKVTIIVTDHNASHKCILGRDILYKVPELRSHMKAMRSEIQEWSTQLERIFLNGGTDLHIKPKKCNYMDELRGAILQLSE